MQPTSYPYSIHTVGNTLCLSGSLTTEFLAGLLAPFALLVKDFLGS